MPFAYLVRALGLCQRHALKWSEGFRRGQHHGSQQADQDGKFDHGWQVDRRKHDVNGSRCVCVCPFGAATEIMSGSTSTRGEGGTLGPPTFAERLSESWFVTVDKSFGIGTISSCRSLAYELPAFELPARFRFGPPLSFLDESYELCPVGLLPRSWRNSLFGPMRHSRSCRGSGHNVAHLNLNAVTT
jgi:hypothetical protein